MRVALFATCLADRFFPEACSDAVHLLRRLGLEVVVPEGQSCCGQPHANAGLRGEARELACRTARLLADADVQHVVLPSGSCAAFLRTHAPHLGPDDPRLGEVASRTWELSQFLVRVLSAEPPADTLRGVRVAYHHGCHALRELGVREEPVALLRAAGATVGPWEAEAECCGFGGLFSVDFPEVSAAMADRKLDTLPHVDVLTSADPGCLLQLAGRAERRGTPVATRHLATLLLQAWAGVGAAGEALA